VIKGGKNDGYIECDVTDEHGKQICESELTCFVLRGQQAKAR